MLLRPTQIRDDLETKKQLENKLSNPHISDKTEVHRQLRRLNKRLDEGTPQPVPEAEKDAFVKETESLKEQFTQGMLSDEDMRKCPPGAIDRHRAWEKANKKKIIQWKNNMLRLNQGCDDVDLVNIEKFRPKTAQLNLDNALIPGKQFFLPETTGPVCVISDEELKILKAKAPPEVYNKLPVMDAEGRRLALQMYVYGD